MVIKYENLKIDAAAEIAKILTYLDMETSVDGIRTLLKDGFKSVLNAN